MRLHLIKCVVLGALAISPLGCEPRPVVVDPDDAEDTTVIEEDDVDIDIDRDTEPNPQPDTGVDVNVGGERGVEVGVGRDSAEQPTENP
jgi:hypothetical protein